MAHLIDHILKLQILAFFFILIFFWILESFSFSQKIAPKISHTVFNAKFLLLVVPVQFILSVGVLLVATFLQKKSMRYFKFLLFLRLPC